MEIAEFVEETGKLEKFYDKELRPFERDIWYQHRGGYDQQTVTSSEPCNQTSSQ